MADSKAAAAGGGGDAAQKAAQLQKILFKSITDLEEEVTRLNSKLEGIRTFEHIKQLEEDTKIILELQKLLSSHPKAPQQYTPPSYADIADEKMRSYKKILHAALWEVQSKLGVIKSYIQKPGAPVEKLVGLAKVVKDMHVCLQSKKKKDEINQKALSTLTNDDYWSVNIEDIEIEKQIGQGSFGKVYVGQYFGTRVAIKKLTVKDEREMTLIKREVDMLKDVRHPNVVAFYGLCRKDDSLLLVQEFVASGELYKLLLDKTVEMDWRLRVSIARDTASGMAYLHHSNIIHRDLKSENLLVDEHWKIKICDFGLARVPRTGARPMTSKIGSPYFMAPEVLLGKQYNEKADVFSYGVVILELITRGDGPPDMMERIPAQGYAINLPKLIPHVPKDCPTELFKLARVCVNVNPDERPSFKKILEIIKAIADSLEQS